MHCGCLYGESLLLLSAGKRKLPTAVVHLHVRVCTCQYMYTVMLDMFVHSELLQFYGVVDICVGTVIAQLLQSDWMRSRERSRNGVLLNRSVME